PARCGPFGPENRHVWIGGDLEHGEPEADDEKRYQEKRVGKKSRGRPEERASRGGNHQADDNAVLISEPRDRIAEAYRDGEVKERADEVGAKEGELHQHRVEVVERERILEPRNEDVVEHRHKSPHEKEDRHDREWAAIGLSRTGRN